jgi:hypothetical protein
MFIYNITTKVNNAILKDWIKWQQEEHIPEILATNLFDQFQFYRLLDQDDAEGSTYIIQYHTSEKSNYETYIKDFAPMFRDKALKKWGNNFISFRSLLETVQ